MFKVFVTCPPMLGMLSEFTSIANKSGLELVAAQTTQVLSEEELVKQVPNYDGWIIGDDPATAEVFRAGKAGQLRAAVKWGIGVDNVDFQACEKLGIPITNTPNMFGGEVADNALGYMIGLARETFYIDREIRNGGWPKPPGMSISEKHIGVVGFGDIGRNTVKRLAGFDVKVTVYDPVVVGDTDYDFVTVKQYPEGLESLDFLIFTCSLNEHNFHMFDDESVGHLKDGAKVINVARGPLIDEQALIKGLSSGKLASAALDVFEEEPLPAMSPLRDMQQCIFGSHNSSNTREGVIRASESAIEKLATFLHES
ncbi:MAG: phosphoglycerate dehydrogenase [Halioglobus sp.]